MASRRASGSVWRSASSSLGGSLSSIEANRQPGPTPRSRRRIAAAWRISSAVSGSSGWAGWVTMVPPFPQATAPGDYRHGMHSVDATTEAMIRSVLAYAENRLPLQPVPLDTASRDPAELDAALRGLLGRDPHDSDQVLGVYTSVIAPAVISADSPRFLGFIPAAPTKASLLFDMLVSCASIQGISWLEAAGAIHAENLVLRLIADRAGMPASAGGCFVSGGSAANLSALVVAREAAKRKAGPEA